MSEEVDGPSARAILGLLGADDRRKVIGALIVGARTIADIVRVAGLNHETVVAALERIVGAGLAERVPASAVDEGGGLRIVPGVFELAAREAASLRRALIPEDLGATAAQAAGMRNWLTEDGRLKSIPIQRNKRMPILDFLAGRFEPGKTYSESAVNLILGEFHADTAAWRRHLVDEEFLERRDGFYWRAGGTFAIDTSESSVC